MNNNYIMKTSYYCEDDNLIILTKEFSVNNIIDVIKENITNQYIYIFGENPEEKLLSLLVDGYILFNSYKNKKMLTNKKELVKYVSNNCISFDERCYFLEIYLHFQRPSFLSREEHDYLREKGTLEGF